MKNLTIKALLISGVTFFSLNAQASVYDNCVADGDNIIKITKEKGSTGAQAYEQKTTVQQCYAELEVIEKKYGDKTKGVNPSSVMTPEDRKKWARLFDSIDAKKFRGTTFLMESYHR